MPCSPGMFIVGGADVLSHAQTAAPFDASQRMLFRMRCTAAPRWLSSLRTSLCTSKSASTCRPITVSLKSSLVL